MSRTKTWAKACFVLQARRASCGGGGGGGGCVGGGRGLPTPLSCSAKHRKASEATDKCTIVLYISGIVEKWCDSQIVKTALLIPTLSPQQNVECVLNASGVCMCVIFLNLTLILLRLFQQHYCYNVTGQSQESEGSCKPARIKEVHSKLHSFQASLCTLTATHLTLIYVCTYIRLSVPLGCLIKQAGIIIHTILKYVGNTGNRTRDI